MIRPLKFSPLLLGDRFIDAKSRVFKVVRFHSGKIDSEHPIVLIHRYETGEIYRYLDPNDDSTDVRKIGFIQENGDPKNIIERSVEYMRDLIDKQLIIRLES